MAIWSFNDNLVYFPPFWYIVSKKYDNHPALDVHLGSPEIVSVLEDDGVEGVRDVGQRIRVLPHEPQRLLGRVHDPALLHDELTEQHVVLQRRVEVLRAKRNRNLKIEIWSQSYDFDLQRQRCKNSQRN
jgi:hypothetical protein